MGVIFNAVGAIGCALIIAFLASWKLTLVVLVFTPFMVFAGMLQGRRMDSTRKRNEKTNENASWEEKGGMVKISFFFNK
jgi:hypothetical protein